MKTAKNILREICNEYNIDLDLRDTKEAFSSLYSNLYGKVFDFSFELDGMEFRIIDEDFINDIHTEEIEELTKDCYLDGNDLPWWVEVDWEETAKNLRDTDGYGHHFNHYDGGELYTDGWYIFRTN